MATRIGITLDDKLAERFGALAEFDNIKPTTLAANIIKTYMEGRASDIEAALRVRDDYQKKIAELRKQKKASE